MRCPAWLTLNPMFHINEEVFDLTQIDFYSSIAGIKLKKTHPNGTISPLSISTYVVLGSPDRPHIFHQGNYSYRLAIVILPSDPVNPLVILAALARILKLIARMPRSSAGLPVPRWPAVLGTLSSRV